MGSNSATDGHYRTSGEVAHPTIRDVIDWSAPLPEFPIESCNTEAFYRIREDWLNRLTILRCASPDDSFFPTAAQIRCFTQFLIEHQRIDTAPDMKKGSWAIPQDIAMPSDARVDFVYFPTYIAVAWLCLVQTDHTDIAKHLEGFDRALRNGLRFASYRKLQGHGYEGNRQCLEAIELLALGKVFSSVRESPGISRPFSRTLDVVETEIVEKMPQDSDWSRTDPVQRDRALALLRGADADDSRVCPPIHARWDEWQRRSDLAQVSRLVAAQIAAALTKLLLRSLTQARASLSQDFEAARPRYTVFRDPARPRGLATAPRPFNAAISAVDYVVEAARDLPAGRVNTRQQDAHALAKQVLPRLANQLPALINPSLETAGLFDIEEFSARVTSVEFTDAETVAMHVQLEG